MINVLDMRLSKKDRYTYEVQAKVLNCAKNMYKKNGLKKTTMALIAESAFLSRRTLYRYYSSKKDIMHHVFIDYLSNVFNYTKNSNCKSKNDVCEMMTEYFMNHQYIVSFMIEYVYYIDDEFDVQNITKIITNIRDNRKIVRKLKKTEPYFNYVDIYNFTRDCMLG